MKTYLKTTIITGVIIAIAYALVTMIVFAWTARPILALRQEVPVFEKMVETGDWGRLASRLPVIVDDFQRARTATRFAGWMRFLPVVRNPFLAYKDAVDAGATVSEVLAHSLQNSLSADGTQIDLKELLSQGLQSYPELLSALTLLQSASARVESFAPDLLPTDVQQQWQSLLALTGQFRQVIEWAQPYIKDVPTVLGADEPFDILFLLQNPHELRATGGFIGTYGRLTFDKGAITTFYTDDIYNLDVALLNKQTLLPPEPMRRYLGIDKWYIRDSNWSPDFPTSARQILSLYSIATDGEDIDMVVAMTPELVESFLEMTGPITVDGITFTSENLLDSIQYRVEQEFWRIGLRDEERKKIINDLAQALKERFLQLDQSQMQTVITSLQTSLVRRDIQVFSTNESIQRQMNIAAWSGEIRSSANDYLAIVDSNLGALKTDRLVDRTYSYTLQEEETGDWFATLQLTYTNKAKAFDYRTTRYRTYTRVYMPVGTTFVSSQGFMLDDKQPGTTQSSQYTELGKFVVAGFVSVEPGQTRIVTIRYQLAPWLAKRIQERDQYDLVWQKQAGTEARTEFKLISAKPLRSFAPSTLSYKLESPQRILVEQPLVADFAYTVGLAP